MAMRKGVLIAVVSWLVGVFAVAQNSCFYLLEMYDSFGDGWNGNELEVTVIRGATIQRDTVTLESGSFGRVYIGAQDGDSLILNYLAGGSWNSEVSFVLLSCLGDTLYKSGSGPATGIHTDTTVNCGGCALCAQISSGNLIEAQALTFGSSNVTLQINYSSNVIGMPPTLPYIYDFDTLGILAGSGTIGGPNLLQDTFSVTIANSGWYRVYGRVICAPGDTTSWIGDTLPLCAGVMTIPYAETFATTYIPMLPPCWQTSDPNFGYATNECNNNSDNVIRLEGVVGTMITSPAFVVNTNCIRLSYTYRAGENTVCGNAPESQDSVAVDVFVNGTWQTITTYNGGINAPTTYTPQSFLININPTDTIYVRFRIINGSGPDFDNWDFDSVSIEPVTVPSVSAPSQDTIKSTDSVSYAFNGSVCDSIIWSVSGPGIITQGGGKTDTFAVVQLDTNNVQTGDTIVVTATYYCGNCATTFTDILIADVAVATAKVQNITVNIYPNPVKDVLHVYTTNTIQIKILDLYGRMLYTEEVKGKTDIDTQSWAPGIYIVQIQTPQGAQKHIKVVKR